MREINCFGDLTELFQFLFMFCSSLLALLYLFILLCFGVSPPVIQGLHTLWHKRKKCDVIVEIRASEQSETLCDIFNLFTSFANFSYSGPGGLPWKYRRLGTVHRQHHDRLQARKRQDHPPRGADSLGLSPRPALQMPQGSPAQALPYHCKRQYRPQ